MLPDSSSSMGPRFSRSLVRLPWSTEKTEAESVEDITAASRKQPMKDAPRAPIHFPTVRYANTPVRMAVRSTPRVESRMPWRRTGLVSCMDVSKPPVSRMMVMAKWPMDSATS